MFLTHPRSEEIESEEEQAKRNQLSFEQLN